MPGWFWPVLASAVLHASWNFSARRVSGNFGVVWVGLALSSLICLPAAWHYAGGFLRPTLPFLAVGGSLNALYFLNVSKAYEAGEMTQVYPISRGTAVVGGVLLGHWILGEAVSASAAGAVAAILAGIFLLGFRRISRAEEASVLFYSLILGGIVALCSLVDKLAMRTAPAFPYIVGLWLIAAALLAPYAWLTHQRSCVEALKHSKLDGLRVCGGSLAAYTLILFAFKRGPLGLISAVRESSILFGAALGVWKLGERLTPRRAAGIAAIASGLVWMRLR